MKNQIPSLNGLRAISITIVITYHFNEHYHFATSKIANYFGFVFFNGAFGVNVFFVISGFLITTLLIKEKQTSGGISLKKFYLRRMIRIFPAYYFLLFVYGILQLLGYWHISLSNWLSNISFTRQFFPDTFSEASHLWSLSVEEVFYLMWPLAFLSIKNNSTTKVTFSIVFFVCLRIWLYRYPALQWDLTIFNRGDSLLVGCLFAINQNKIVAYVKSHSKLVLLV